MLSGPSFMLTFVFSINTLSLSGFPFTSFQLAEDYLSCGFILLCVQFSKNMKYVLFIIIHIFSTHFAINLFYLRNLKTETNYGAATTLCM